MEPGPLSARIHPEPWELAGEYERQCLVGGFEDLTPLEQLVAPRRLVSRDAGMQYQVVVAAGHRDRIELDRPQSPQDVEHAVDSPRDRPRRREEVPSEKKTTRRIGRDPHPTNPSGPANSFTTLLSDRDPTTDSAPQGSRDFRFAAGEGLNLRPSGYEPILGCASQGWKCVAPR